MEKLIIFILASALVGLFFSRIHFHFSFNLTISRRGRVTSPGGPLPAAVRSISDPGVTKALEAASRVAEADIASALINLGLKAPKAKEVAKKAMGQGKDFDARIKWAIQNAA